VKTVCSVPERVHLEDLGLDETIKTDIKVSYKLGNKHSDSKNNMEFD